MKPFWFLLTFLVALATNACAQVPQAVQGKRVSATEVFTLRDKRIDSLSTDTSLAGKRNTVFPSQAAVKEYVDKRKNYDRPVYGLGWIKQVNDSTLALHGDTTSTTDNPAYYGTNGAGSVGIWPFPVTGGGGGVDTAYAIHLTLNQFRSATGLNTNVWVNVTDAGRSGLFRYLGPVSDNTTDNDGTVIVTADNQQWIREYQGDILGSWFGIVPNDESKAASNYAGWLKALAARRSGQTLRLAGGGLWWFNNTLVSIQNDFVLQFRSSIIIEGTVKQTDPTKDGIWLEGGIAQYFRVGAVDGANTGANDSTTFNAYQGTGIVIKNCYNLQLEFSQITDFRNGIWMLGDNSNGSQYCNVDGSGPLGSGKIFNNYIQILMTIGVTGSPRWNNENTFKNIQLGSGTQQGARGTYGLIMTGTPGSVQASSFESTDFWYVSFEGLRHGAKLDYASSTNFYNCRVEGPACKYPFNFSNTNAVHTKFFGAGPFIDDFFVNGNRGAWTQLVGGQVWAEVEVVVSSISTNAISTGSKTFEVATNQNISANNTFIVNYDAENYLIGTVTSYNVTTGVMVVNVTSAVGAGTYGTWSFRINNGQGRAGEELHTLSATPTLIGMQNQAGKLVIKGMQYPGFSAMNLLQQHKNIIQLYNLAERYTTENGIIKVDSITRWGAYKKTISLITSQTTVNLPANIGYVKFNPTSGNVTAKIWHEDLSTNKFEDFYVEVEQMPYSLTFVNSSTGSVLIPAARFTGPGMYHCFYRDGSFKVIKDDDVQATAAAQLTVAAPGTGNASALEIDPVAGTIKAHAATATSPGIVTTGAQDFAGTKGFDSTKTRVATIQNTGGLKVDIVGRNNGFSVNDNSTAGASTPNLITSYNWGSGVGKDILFTFGKTGITSVGFGNNGTNAVYTTEKVDNGFEWRRGIGWASASLTAGTKLMELFPSGNLRLQLGGTFADDGYKLSIGGNANIDGLLSLGSLTADPTGKNGDIYYNSTNNKFRAFQAGAWTDLIGSGGTQTPSGSYTIASTLGSGNNVGMSIASGTTIITPHGANATQPGLVTAGVQTFGGDKTFNGAIKLRASAQGTGLMPLYFPAGVIPATPQNGWMFSNGTYLYFGASNAWQSLTTNSNVQTLTNKTWDGVPIQAYKINGFSMIQDPVLTTTGSDNGTYWGENHGGFMRFHDITTSATFIYTWDLTEYIPNNTSGEIEIILIGERPDNGATYSRHYYQAYNKRNGAFTAKGTLTSINPVNDFSHVDLKLPIQPGGIGINYCSPSNGINPDGIQVEWTAYVKIRPTITIQ